MRPTPEQLLSAVDVTWPAARFVALEPWLLREGMGGGQRVSSASALRSIKSGDIDTAIAAMHKLNQHPLFMIRQQDDVLDQLLKERGFAKKDPVTAYLA